MVFFAFEVALDPSSILKEQRCTFLGINESQTKLPSNLFSPKAPQFLAAILAKPFPIELTPSTESFCLHRHRLRSRRQLRPTQYQVVELEPEPEPARRRIRE